MILLKNSQILRKQDLVIVFVTQVCSKEQREDFVGSVNNSQTQDCYICVYREIKVKTTIMFFFLQWCVRARMQFGSN